MSRFPILLAILTRMSCMDPAPSQPTSPSPVSAPAPTTPAPSGPSAIFITPAGFSPSEVTIAVGGRVTFINDDTRPHDLVGGLDPARPECPEIAIAGFLSPGQRRDTGVFTAARDRDFHDHAAIGVPAVQGKILIR